MNEQILSLIYWLVGSAFTITGIIVSTYVVVIRRIDANRKTSDIAEQKILGKMELFSDQMKNWNLVITQQLDHVNDKTETNTADIKAFEKRFNTIEGRLQTIENILK